MAVVTLISVSVQADDTEQDFAASFPPPSKDMSSRRLDHTGSAPPPSIMEKGGWDGPFLRLTEEVNSQRAQLSYNQLSDPAENLLIKFDLRISPGLNTGADGVSLALLNVDNFGADTTAAAPNVAEEPNLAGSLGVGFDTFNNELQGDGGESSVSLHFDGVRLISVSIDDELGINSLETGDVLHIEVEIEESNVTVTITDDADNSITPISEFVEGLGPYAFRLCFGSRTGGANANQDLDNVVLEVEGDEVLNDTFDEAIEPPEIVPAEPLGGTPFTFVQFGSNPPPQVLRSAEGGPAGDFEEAEGFARLAHEAGGQIGLLAFDQTSDRTEEIEARFLYRGLDGGLSGRADGAGFLLLDVFTYGETGADLIPNANPWEDPNLAGAFGVGFDTFNNNVDEFGNDGIASPGLNVGNHMSLHWNGERIAVEGIPREELDLVNNEWNFVTIEIFEAEGVGAGGVLGSVVTVAIEDGTDGSEHIIFDEVFIPGMRFPEGARVAFAARTGGAADNYDIDDVIVTFGDSVVDVEDCGNEIDDDGDELIDCDDPDCEADVKNCPPPDGFVRGDSNSSGVIDLTDGVITLNFLFTGGRPPACLDSADTDDNGALVISDAVIIFSYLFTGGPAPVSPSPSATSYAPEDCGPDATDDALDCAALSATCT
jgi:hypothetical protein